MEKHDLVSLGKLQDEELLSAEDLGKIRHFFFRADYEVVFIWSTRPPRVCGIVIGRVLVDVIDILWDWYHPEGFSTPDLKIDVHGLDHTGASTQLYGC